MRSFRSQTVEKAANDPALRAASASQAYAYSDHEHIMCVLGNVLFTYSLAAPSARYLAACSDVIERLEPPALLLTVIDSRARAPDSASKAAIRQLVTRHESRIAGLAYVIEGEGFGAAAIRSALSLINLAARYRFPQRVTATAGEAIPWLLEQLPLPLRVSNEPQRLARLVDTVRAELHQKATPRIG